jgi:hypothetical protein
MVIVEQLVEWKLAGETEIWKPAPVPLCPPQISHDQIGARTWAAVVGSQRLTAWATVRPDLRQSIHCKFPTDQTKNTEIESLTYEIMVNE